MKSRAALAFLMIVLGLALAGGAWAQSRAEMINGNHWTKWSQEHKLVYVRGLTNWADFVTRPRRRKGRPPNTACRRSWSMNCGTRPWGQIVNDIDTYYRENPGKMNDSVIEAMLRHCTNVCKTAPGAKGGMK